MRRSQRILGRLGLVLFGLVAGVALLAALELSLWAVGAGEGPPAYDPFQGFSAAVPLFERGRRPDGAEIFAVSRARLADSASRGVRQPEREFLAEKPARGFRVFVVGESSAAGFPYPTAYAFGAFLARRLQAALPEVPIEVVNAAVAGYSSRRALLVAREVAVHEPDLLIVYSGHNEWAERRYYSRLVDMDPRLFRLRERLIATRLFTVLSHSPLLRPESHEEALERFMRDEQREFQEMFAVFSRRVEGHDYATAEQLAQRDELYRLNLEEIVRAGLGAGARVMLLTLSQNFADWAPGASTHRAGLGADEAARFAARFEAGERAREAGDCRAALRSFEEALAIDAEYAALHYAIAQCQRALGSWDEARRHYRLASDLDRVPYGAPIAFNDVVRRIAAAHDLLLVDVDALMLRESEHGLVGDDLFVEFAHPNLRANQRIAAEIASVLRAAGIPRPAPEWRDGYADPAPEALHAANPDLRIREHEAVRFVCLLARRTSCVQEQDAALARLRAAPALR
jgi:lysophospholipase L1-like esterase